MCTIAAAALAFSAVGTAVQYKGTQDAAAAEAGMFNYQAGVDRNNAQIAEWQAQDSEKRGKEEERKRRLTTSAQKGDQRVAFAANGIDLSSENVSDTLADTAMIGELDALTIRNNAKREAYDYRNQASNYTASAGAKTAAASNAKSAGKTAGMATILGGASTIAGSMSTNKQKTGSVWG